MLWAATSTSTVAFRVAGGAPTPAGSPCTAAMIWCSWPSARAAVASTVARSPAPTTSRSCAASAGQAGSRSVRCRSTQHRQLLTPGITSGPTSPAPSRIRTGRCGTPPTCRSRTSRGSAARVSASTTRSTPLTAPAALPWLLRLTRAHEQRSPSASRSDSGPPPCTRIDSARAPARGERAGATTPAETSSARRTSSSAGSHAPPAQASRRRSEAVIGALIARSSAASPPGDSPPGGRTSTARRGSQPICTAPSGRSSTGIAGSRAYRIR